MIREETKAIVGREGEEGEIEVRCSLLEDEPRIAALLEFHGVPYRLANEERFLIAQRSGGGILAALEYRTVINGLMLGCLVTDPRVEERPLARALYAEAHALAGSLAITDIRARPTLYGDYPYDVGYWRWGRNWRSSIIHPLVLRGELPEGGWRRMIALFRVFAVPFLRVPWKQAGELIATETSSISEAKLDEKG